MKLPIPSPIQKLERITPTIYEAALKCTARAAWIAHGDAQAETPRHPRALLGLGGHAVLEEARRGAVQGAELEERRKAAGQLFDNKMEQLFRAAHPMLVAKFGSHDRLPYYHLQRERTALIAAEFAWPNRLRVDGMDTSTGRTGALIESVLQSRDGKIAGRPDVMDRDAGTVIDYKTGARPAEGGLTEGEERQLRLYAFLGIENGLATRNGLVIRSDRSRAEIEISEAQAIAEAARARDTLDTYNRNVGRSFADAATPSATSCRFCPCIAFCDAFWQAAEETWAAECGSHLEGEVAVVQGQTLLSVEIDVRRGTAPRGSAVLTRLSRRWLTFDGSQLPAPGDVLRATDVVHIEGSGDPAILRADRVSTAVWTVALARDRSY